MHSHRNPDSSVKVVEPGGASLCGPHRIGAFALCPQLEAFSHDLHLRPVVEKPAPKIGTLVHGALAYRYGAPIRTQPDIAKWFVYRDGYEYLAHAGMHVPSMRDTAAVIYQEYERVHGPIGASPWRPVLVEYQFVTYFDVWSVKQQKMLKEPYSCRTDLLAWDVTRNCYAIIDHKSMGRLPKPAIIQTRYETDRQMLTNIALARAAGYDIQALLINGISREMPQPSFQVYEVQPNSIAYARLGEDTQSLLDRLVEIRDKFPDPTNRPRTWEACAEWIDEETGQKHRSPYGDVRCEYYGLCTGRGNWHDFVGREALTKR